MSVDAKQREWIWEFFLKNCKDARMIAELMNALPFPEENLDIKRMLLLRSLSLQVSAGIIDEFTLDILRGLGEVNRVSGVGPSRERRALDSNSQQGSKRRKSSEDESSHRETTVFVGSTFSSTPQVKDGRVPSSSKDDARKAEPVVGIRDWMKGRALPRSVGGKQSQENTNGSNTNMEGACSGHAGTPQGVGDWNCPGTEFVFRPAQSAKQWELELGVMLELAVKHLRGGSPDKNSFEQALTKLWGDFPDDTDVWPVSDRQAMVRARDNIKSELWIVRETPELLDSVVEKYPKANVEDVLKIYLEKAWAATGQTFLERVSADVVSGKYKPVNSNSQRPKKAGSPLDDGDPGQQSNPNIIVDTSEKPWIRASRGRYSRSREKLQKNFATWELDDNEEGSGAAPKPPSSGERDKHVGEQQPGGGSLKKKPSDGGEARPSVRFDPSVVRLLEFEELNGPENEPAKQPGQEKQDPVRAGTEIPEAQRVSDQADGAETVSVGRDGVDVTVTTPITNAQDVTTACGESNVGVLPESKGTSGPDGETTAKSASSREGTAGQGTESGSPHEVVNIENDAPPSSPKAMDPNPTVSFSPPPWVEGSPAAHVAEGIAARSVARRRKSGPIQDDTAAASRREEESRSVEAVGAPATNSNQSPGTVSTQMNLRRKQRVLDGVVQDPLPKILTSRAKVNLLERNATARKVEWDDDDDIEESPSSSPSASKQVRLPHPTAERTLSPLVNSSGNVNVKQSRRKHRRWTDMEVESLKSEVVKYGKGRWKLILEKNQDTFPTRTEVDLKDKWRNIERFEGITE